jgi:ribonuclease J
MERNISLARSLNILKVPDEALIDVTEIEDYPKSQLCIISTGSQGEPRSSLSKSAQGSGKWLHINNDDVIIFSSRTIPGNEKRIGRLVNNLLGLGARVINDETLKTHTSGHGQRQELFELHKAAQPEWFVPVHGELRHLMAHKQLAVENGMESGKALVATDGDQILMEDKGLSLNRKKCKGRYIFSQGSIIESGHGLFKERNILGKEGCVIASVTVTTDDKCLKGSPIVISKGWLNEDLSRFYEDEIKEQLSKELPLYLRQKDNLTHDRLTQKVRRITGKVVNDRTKRRPMIIPIVEIIS